jgi:hypothetical protein
MQNFQFIIIFFLVTVVFAADVISVVVAVLAAGIADVDFQLSHLLLLLLLWDVNNVDVDEALGLQLAGVQQLGGVGVNVKVDDAGSLINKNFCLTLLDKGERSRRLDGVRAQCQG